MRPCPLCVCVISVSHDTSFFLASATVSIIATVRFWWGPALCVCVWFLFPMICHVVWCELVSKVWRAQQWQPAAILQYSRHLHLRVHFLELFIYQPWQLSVVSCLFQVLWSPIFVLSVVSCQLSIIYWSFVLIAASSNMSWGGKKQRGEECIGAFKRQRRSNAADAGRNAAADDDVKGPWCLPDDVALYIVAWGAEYKYGGNKGGSALACFLAFAFTTVGIRITFTQLLTWNHIAGINPRRRQGQKFYAWRAETPPPGGVTYRFRCARLLAEWSGAKR